jgi:hypothetical protein
MRKLATPIIVVLGLAVVVVGVLFAQSATRAASLERERDDLLRRVSAVQDERNNLKERIRASTPTRFSEEFMVSAGMIQTYRFSPPSSSGTLTGTWRSSGSGTGGVNHTINQFRLTDPKDAMLERSEYAASSGRFFVKVSAQGGYTFFFDNTGPFRSSPRRIFLEGEFKPD